MIRNRTFGEAVLVFKFAEAILRSVDHLRARLDRLDTISETDQNLVTHPGPEPTSMIWAPASSWRARNMLRTWNMEKKNDAWPRLRSNGLVKAPVPLTSTADWIALRVARTVQVARPSAPNTFCGR